jgi:hypothetical protein
MEVAVRCGKHLRRQAIWGVFMHLRASLTIWLATATFGTQPWVMAMQSCCCRVDQPAAESCCRAKVASKDRLVSNAGVCPAPSVAGRAAPRSHCSCMKPQPAAPMEGVVRAEQPTHVRHDLFLLPARGAVQSVAHQSHERALPSGVERRQLFCVWII